MTHVIIDSLVNKNYPRVDDLKRLSEQEEALIRSHAIVMIDRNLGKRHIIKKVLKRFKGCISH